MNTISQGIFAATAVAVLGFGSLNAAAGSETTVTADNIAEPTERRVSVADLDLTSPEGQEALYYRLSRAAEQVCGSSNLREAGSVAMATRNRDCFEDSLSRAMADVSSAAVAATH